MEKQHKLWYNTPNESEVYFSLLHENIAYLKKKSGLTSAQIAKELNVSKSSVEKWLTGERQPRLDKLSLLAQLLNVTLDDLVNGQIVFESNGQKKSDTN